MRSSRELEEIVRGWFASLARGDPTWVEQHVSQNPQFRFIGTAPEERLQGAEAIALLRAGVKAIGGHAQIEVLSSEAFTEGSVGWGHAMVNIILESGQSVSPRWTGVFHQEDGQWKAVQIHGSAGLSNEELFGMSISSQG